MTKLKWTDKLNKEEEELVYALLCEVDREFIPQLSARDSSVFKIGSKSYHEAKPKSYFTDIKQQKFILAYSKKDLMGFLTYKDNFKTSMNSDLTMIGHYITTIAISEAYRGKGVASKLYLKLIEVCKNETIYTRTWSTNYGHIKILERMGFNLSHSIKDDRGLGIDTVYYLKK